MSTRTSAAPDSLAWFRGKRVTVMGLGLNGGGVGMARWLILHGAVVTVTDLKDRRALASSVTALERAYQRAVRIAKNGTRSRAVSGTGTHRDSATARIRRVRYVLGRHNERDFRNADLVIKGPGVPDGNAFIAIARNAGVPVETDVSLFFLLTPVPVIGVTGTRGKTTTTALIADMCLRADHRTVSAGNNRVSVMDAVDALIVDAAREQRSHATPRPVVLELSSFMLEGLAPHYRSPHIAVITNVMRDHLNRYRSMAHYAATKAGIARFQRPDDVSILNADDAYVKSIVDCAPGRVLQFSMRPLPRGTDGAFVRAGRLIARVNGEETLVVQREDIAIPGDHNVPNVLAATLAAMASDVPLRHIRAAIRAFRGVPGRLERVAEICGVAFVNDTTATSPDGSIAALRAVASLPRSRGRTVLIAGGADKMLAFSAWGREARARARHVVFLPGTATATMQRALRTAGMPDTRTHQVKDMNEAVRVATALAERGGTVLLSPGCASFGLFMNEFDRGDRFVRAVARLRRTLVHRQPARVPGSRRQPVDRRPSAKHPSVSRRARS